MPEANRATDRRGIRRRSIEVALVTEQRCDFALPDRARELRISADLSSSATVRGMDSHSGYGCVCRHLLPVATAARVLHVTQGVARGRGRGADRPRENPKSCCRFLEEPTIPSVKRITLETRSFWAARGLWKAS